MSLKHTISIKNKNIKNKIKTINMSFNYYLQYFLIQFITISRKNV